MPTIGTRALALVDRALAAIGVMRATVPTSGIYWPGSGGYWWSNGDRGPPGSWQMNANSPYRGQELLAFSAVYACVNTIASDIAKLPAQVFEIDIETGARQPRRQDFYATLMRAPNEYMTGPDFLKAFVQSYLLQGNTYVYTGTRNGRGEIAEMHVLNPYRTRPLIADDGSIFYEHLQDDYLSGLKANQVIPARDIIHHRLPLLPGFPLIGVTPVFAAAASSAVGLKILQNSQQFFSNASRPSGMLVTDQKIPKELAERYKQDWEQAYSGEGTGKVALLHGGMKWEPLTITAQDAQLIEQLRWSVEDVARVFRVPPFMLGDMTKVSYRNTEQLARAYLTGCLSYHIEALERRFAAAFQFGSVFEFKLDLSALLRTEIDVRFAAYQTALNSGWQSINEVRAQEGLGPVEGGDEPRVQMQYVPLSQAIEPPAPAEPAPAPPPPSNEPPPTEPPPEPPPPPEATIDPAHVRALVQLQLTA
jgi:HK97 family phage portal protein